MVKPHGSRLLIEKIDNSIDKSPGGVIVPDNCKPPPQQGRVIAVGDDAIGFAEGQLVIFGRIAGVDVEIGHDKFFLLDASEVLATIIE